MLHVVILIDHIVIQMVPLVLNPCIPHMSRDLIMSLMTVNKVMSILLDTPIIGSIYYSFNFVDQPLPAFDVHSFDEVEGRELVNGFESVLLCSNFPFDDGDDVRAKLCLVPCPVASIKAIDESYHLDWSCSSMMINNTKVKQGTITVIEQNKRQIR
jgi:hypothetical protein